MFKIIAVIIVLLEIADYYSIAELKAIVMSSMSCCFQLQFTSVASAFTIAASCSLASETIYESYQLAAVMVATAAFDLVHLCSIKDAWKYVADNVITDFSYSDDYGTEKTMCCYSCCCCSVAASLTSSSWLYFHLR